MKQSHTKVVWCAILGFALAAAINGLADAAVALKAFDQATAAIEQASRFNPSNQAVKDAAQRLTVLRR